MILFVLNETLFDNGLKMPFRIRDNLRLNAIKITSHGFDRHVSPEEIGGVTVFVEGVCEIDWRVEIRV